METREQFKLKHRLIAAVYGVLATVFIIFGIIAIWATLNPEYLLFAIPVCILAVLCFIKLEDAARPEKYLEYLQDLNAAKRIESKIVEELERHEHTNSVEPMPVTRLKAEIERLKDKRSELLEEGDMEGWSQLDDAVNALMRRLEYFEINKS